MRAHCARLACQYFSGNDKALRRFRRLLGAAAAMPVEPALEATPIARHGEAANEEEGRGEDVALLGEAEPGGILERLVDRPQEVDEADDGDERGVLEEID